MIGKGIHAPLVAHILLSFIDVREGLFKMELNVGDIVRLRKAHPCGNTEFKVMRTGMDFRIECLKCGHQTWITRIKLERNIKEVLSSPESNKE